MIMFRKKNAAATINLLVMLSLCCCCCQHAAQAAALRGEATPQQQEHEQRELEDANVPIRKVPDTDKKDNFKIGKPSFNLDDILNDASDEPSEAPSLAPFPSPTAKPTPSPTTSKPTVSGPVVVTYTPGKITEYRNALRMSEGLDNRIMAVANQTVLLKDGVTRSEEPFHNEPDGAAVYADPDTGGWIYVSNSESRRADGGVGAIYFDKDGNVLNYKKLLKGTTRNCSGGKTPWNSWVSCEEYPKGTIFQVDPYGNRESQETTMGQDMGHFESFAYDIRDPSQPHYFVTEDQKNGPLRRFTPTNPNWDDPWTMLHGPGTLEFLLLNPTSSSSVSGDVGRGTYSWTTDKEAARANAEQYYRNTEGMDAWKGELFFVSKVQKELFVLDLDSNKYESFSTKFGLFDGQPDQMKRLVGGDDLVYYCEEGGRDRGIHARDSNGWFFTIVESPVWIGETSGIAFSPDGKHLYFSFQVQGIVYDVWRKDGLPFYGKTLDINYHGDVNSRKRQRRQLQLEALGIIEEDVDISF